MPTVFAVNQKIPEMQLIRIVSSFNFLTFSLLDLDISFDLHFIYFIYILFTS